MVEPLRHRQTKEAETDMFSLQPPRHIPTLPIVFTRGAGKLDPRTIADKVVRACREGRVRTVEGDDIDIEFDSICFHSDTPGSLEIGRTMRAALVANGVRIAPPSEVLARRAEAFRKPQ